MTVKFTMTLHLIFGPGDENEQLHSLAIWNTCTCAGSELKSIKFPLSI